MTKAEEQKLCEDMAKFVGLKKNISPSGDITFLMPDSAWTGSFIPFKKPEQTELVIQALLKRGWYPNIRYGPRGVSVSPWHTDTKTHLMLQGYIQETFETAGLALCRVAQEIMRKEQEMPETCESSDHLHRDKSQKVKDILKCGSKKLEEIKLVIRALLNRGWYPRYKDKLQTTKEKFVEKVRGTSSEEEHMPPFNPLHNHNHMAVLRDIMREKGWRKQIKETDTGFHCIYVSTNPRFDCVHGESKNALRAEMLAIEAAIDKEERNR